MRRSVCYCEPHHALAGEVGTWKFLYTPSVGLGKGGKLRFDLQSKGRSIDWETPESSLKAEGNVIYALLPGGAVLSAQEIEIPGSIVPQFEFTLPTPVKAGETVAFVLGAPPKKKGGLGNRAQLTLQRRRPFLLHVDPKGKGNFEEPELFSLDIRGNKLSAIRIFVPSFVTKNKRFDVTMRFEDAYGNLTNHAPADTLIELSYEHLRENLNWKLFVPETGFVVLPNLYFNEVGIYRIQLKNLATKELFFSPPMCCYAEAHPSLYWGTLHGESEKIDSAEDIESCLCYFRDEKTFHFFASSPFESAEETSNDLWKLISQNVAEFNEEGRFLSFLGFQWEGDPGTEGVRHLLYAKDNKALLRRKESKYSSLSKIYKSVAPKELLSVPCFTMAKGHSFNFQEFFPECERVVEIYNAWGSSESTLKEGNTLPITSEEGEGVEAEAHGSLQAALRRNLRFGFVAGGLDDRGCYSGLYEGDQQQYPPGLTAIFSEKMTREALFDALYRRACYATTGVRILVHFSIAGGVMGSELSTQTKPGLSINRHISGYVAGTERLKTVEIVRNGHVWKSFSPEKIHLEFSVDDMQSLKECTLKGGEERPPFVYYYVRVLQEDGHMAWSSPIWIDDMTPKAVEVPSESSKAAPSEKKRRR